MRSRPTTTKVHARRGRPDRLPRAGSSNRIRSAAGPTTARSRSTKIRRRRRSERRRPRAHVPCTLNRDSSGSRPALADYVLIFRKPGENQTRIVPDCDNETWIEWARPVWYDIRETATLNTQTARDDADERHICPVAAPADRAVRPVVEQPWRTRAQPVRRDRL